MIEWINKWINDKIVGIHNKQTNTIHPYYMETRKENNKRKAENEHFQSSPGIYILTRLGGGNQF